MSTGQNGKGSKPRPFSVSREEFEANWDAIFGKRPPQPLSSGTPCGISESNRQRLERLFSDETLARVLIEDYAAPAEWTIPSIGDILNQHEKDCGR